MGACSVSRRRATLKPADRHDCGRLRHTHRGSGRPGITGRYTFRVWRGNLSKVLTSADLAKSGSEHGHQRAFFNELRLMSPEVFAHTFAIPNGGARGEDAKTKAIRGGQLKAEGVKAGVPDVMCAWPYSFDLHIGSQMFIRVNACGLFIEMKKPKKGVVADKQNEWHALLVKRGYAVAVAYDWIEAINVIRYYFGQTPATDVIWSRFVNPRAVTG